MTALIFLGALIAPFLYAVCNHLDKHILSKHFKENEKGVGVLVLFSALLSCVTVPVAFIIEPNVLNISLVSIATLLVVGIINVGLLWGYLKAMDEDEPTAVIIFYQLVPVVGLGLGYLLLGETISVVQSVAMVLIMVGAVVMTFAQDEDGQITMKLRTIGFMLLASFGWAAESVLFKWVALEENVWHSLFWEGSSETLIGVVLFMLIPSWRTQFLSIIRGKKPKVIGLNVTNEVVYNIGNMAAYFMVVLIPVSLNLLMNSFQPIFVFIIGVALSRFLSNHATESATDRWKQKLIAIVLTGAGAYLIGEW